MKNLFAALLAGALFLQTPAAGDDLVEAASASRSKRKKSTSRVFTNADVAKSKGTLIETRGGTPQESLPAPESLIEKQQAERAERTAYQLRLELAETVVADLQKQLTALEQSYFAESDLTRRDEVIARQFQEVREKLDAALQELSALQPPE